MNYFLRRSSDLPSFIQQLQVLKQCQYHPVNKFLLSQKDNTCIMAKAGILGRSSSVSRSNEGLRIILSAVVGIMLGYLFGISFPTVNITKLHFPSSIVSYIEDRNSGITTQTLLNHAWTSAASHKKNNSVSNPDEIPKLILQKKFLRFMYQQTLKVLKGIVVSETDLYLRRLWGEPSEDLTSQPRYLVTFTVGYSQKANIDSAVKKFSENFTIMLFHYDGRTTEWDEFEWSKRAIHVSVRKQTKWWYAKRFLHPDIVARDDYIFIWDEDLGVNHFNAEAKHGLEISQPGLEPDKGLTWEMTKRRGYSEVHKWSGNARVLASCEISILTQCFLQNDLVHGWGLDFALRKCVEPAHEKIGVVDSQWIVHQVIPSLGNQVRERCRQEWGMFQTRLADAERAYYLEHGITPPISTGA
ncbi:uncharacterized protein C2845_PM13G16790 [Panicum miliaceum]|uniref:Uncharacterized protein n=1 Tax=Panicum miliaceum TaxID=4540 RepID=A0A3L6RJ34_PANMI|nr:uncharacterized protein C2845_PM13G16790 [Panicum miliaceum]